MPSLKTQIQTASSVIKPISMGLNNMQMTELCSRVFGTHMEYFSGRNRLRWYLYTNSKKSSLGVFLEWYESAQSVHFSKANRVDRQSLTLGIFEEPKVLDHPVAVLILEQAVASAQRLVALARSKTHT